MAAQDLEKLVVQLSADITKYERAMARASNAGNKQLSAIERRAVAMNKNLSNSFSSIGSTAAKAFAILGGARGFQSLSDSATNITNALKVAGLSGDELAKTYDRLFASAQKNSAPIESLVQLYSRVSLVQKQLGVSSDQLVGLTDNVGKALRISGSSAEASSGALLQLAQALGGSKIQAEEWGSLVDGMPALLQAAASGIKQAGGDVSKLTALVKAGKLSNRAFFDGIEAGSHVLDEKLAGSTQTIAQRFNNLRNSLINATTKFNENSSAAETVGKAIGKISTEIDQINFNQLILQIGEISSAFNQARTTAEDFFRYLGDKSGASAIGAALVDMLPGDETVKSYFGGALTIKQNDLITSRINDAFAGQIENAGKLTADAIQNSVLGQKGAKTGRVREMQGPKVPDGWTPQQVDLDGQKYKVPSSGSGKTKRDKLDDYDREVKQVQERTAAIEAQTKAQESLSGTIFILEEGRP
ncbi:hypothetical protein A6U87_17560 [Rhizobium sp. AC44/96]|uniref:tape measure protein n=1 Tax=Rhizobium sp. AC44/96 TaxID=1841654 RepID=UPI00080FC277|nr:tape measure protein [Rhizobium sp. AC44/96]OCJ03742.1 hypothetical protein A6U87_17560 [Rhizobium sp. AC44/96]